MDRDDEDGRDFMKLIERVIEKPQDHDMKAVVDRVESFFGIPRPDAAGWIDHVMIEQGRRRRTA